MVVVMEDVLGTVGGGGARLQVQDKRGLGTYAVSGLWVN